MQNDSIRRYRRWYAKLLRLYAKPHYERFGEGMEQTFSDLLQERAEEGSGLFGYACWMIIETFVGIVKENVRFIVMQYKNVIRIALATAFILLLPWLAMQFTDEVVWSVTDFAVAGVLLFGAGLAYELVAKKGRNLAYQAAVGVAVAAALVLVWLSLGVGIIGQDGDPANLMYFGVLAIGITGAFVARLQPHGMARALFATALAQALIAAVALVVGLGYPWSGPLEIVLLNGFFVALFVGSAWLFRRAARGRPEWGAA